MDGTGNMADNRKYLVVSSNNNDIVIVIIIMMIIATMTINWAHHFYGLKSAWLALDAGEASRFITKAHIGLSKNGLVPMFETIFAWDVTCSIVGIGDLPYPQNPPGFFGHTGSQKADRREVMKYT